MSEMVERVEAAIKAALSAHAGDYVGESPRYGNKTQLDGDFDLTAIARAVIAAMREPTNGMRMIGLSGIEAQAALHVPVEDFPASGRVAEEVWQSMIDEALQ